jgi:hypothetical protein
VKQRWLILLFAVALDIAACHKRPAEAPSPVQAAEDPALVEARRIDGLWQQRVAVADRLASKVDLGGSPISCSTVDNGQPARQSISAASNRLMSVSESKNIVFLIHGFEWNSDTGEQSVDNIRRTFSDIIDVASSDTDTAICLVSWKSQLGFEEGNDRLQQAIAAIRLLASDPLVKVPDGRRIIVFGYSAGGSYAENAIVHLSDTQTALSQQVNWTSGPSEPVELRLVTVVTPHHGSQLTNLALGGLEGIVAGAQLKGMFGTDEDRQKAAEARDRLNEIERRPGVRQLQPDDPDVESLNRALSQLAGAVTYLNVYSLDDDVVPISSARWSNALEYAIPSAKHTRALSAPFGTAWWNVLNDVFLSRPLDQAEIDKSVADGVAEEAAASSGRALYARAASQESPRPTAPPPLVPVRLRFN